MSNEHENGQPVTMPEDPDAELEMLEKEAPFVAPYSGTITWTNFRTLSDPEKYAFIERGGIVAGI